MGLHMSRRPVYTEDHTGINSDPEQTQNCETRSWLDCTFKRDVSSVPGSLNSSWVNLEFTCNPPLVQSTTPHDSIDGLPLDSAVGLSQGSTDEVDSQGSEDVLVTSTPTQERSLTLADFGAAVQSNCVGEDPVSRAVFQMTESLQSTPVHCARPFRTNRSWTFSGAGSEYHNQSPRHSLFSELSCLSESRPYSPHAGDCSLGHSSSLAREKGAFISGLFQRHYYALIDQINPPEVAQQLYNLAILNSNELTKATSIPCDGAQAIVLCLKKKLRLRPELFSDVSAALNKAGVDVIKDIKAEVRSRYPDDESLTRSVSALSRPSVFDSIASTTSEPESSISSGDSGHTEHVMVTLEEAFRDGRLTAAKQIISREVAKQSTAPLLFEACKLDVNVCVLNLMLTEATLDVNITTEHKRTPLHVACSALGQCAQTTSPQELQVNGHKATTGEIKLCQDQLKQQRMKIENLLRHGADPTLQDQDYNTALHLTVLRRDVEAMGILLKHTTAAIDSTNRVGNTALHIACRESHTEMVQLLCAHDANTTLPNRVKGHYESLCDTQRSETNKTPLHYACYWGSLDLVVPLMDKDSSLAYINAQDRNGDTALHVAGRRGHKGIIKLLISKGAIKDTKNQDGKTAVDLARQWEHTKAVKLLEKKSPWLSRRRRRSSGVLRRVNTQLSITSEDRGVVSAAESDCDETIDY